MKADNSKRYCKCGCGINIKNKHPNSRFLNSKHKDNYWNRRKIDIDKELEIEEILDECEMGWDSHKGWI